MIRSTFYAFETARNALTNSQLGLDTVGHNISNINTVGYTRQRVDQVSFKTNVTATKYTAYGHQIAGQGSTVSGINNIRDPYLDRRYRNEAAQAGEYNALSTGMADINAIFDELMQNGSHAKIGEFLDQLDKLIATADSKEQANVLRNKAEQLCQVIGSNYNQLISVRKQQQDDLQYAVNDINGILSEIAMLNQKIKEANLYGNPANELCDDRNVLIDQLSEFIDIDVKYVPKTYPDGSTISELKIEIKGSGFSDKGIDPIVLVEGATYTGLKLEIDDATGMVSVHYADPLNDMAIPILQSDGSYSSDITNRIMTGIVKGHLHILNGKGVDAANGEDTYRGIPYYLKTLDDYAVQLATVMNENNALKIYGPDGEIDTIPRDLFVSKEAGKPLSASTISVSEYWTKNPQYIETASKNNALYTDPTSGNLCYRDNTNDPPVPIDTGIHWSAVGGVDAEGYLLGASGSRITDGAGKEMNIADLQRAITTNDFDDISTMIKYFADPATDELAIDLGVGGTLNIDGSTPPSTSYAYWDQGGGVYVALSAGDIGGMDEDGFLLDHAGNKIKIVYDNNTGTPTSFDLKKSDLFRFNDDPEGGYIVGEPTPNVLLPGASANDALLDLKILLKEASHDFDNGFSGTFQEYLVSLQSDMSLDKQSADSKLSASIKVLSNLANQRDGISAVSIDEEGISMMTYQNYYNAAARYMTVLDEALGTIIQGMGVVGR